jgi:hypothetical protein
MTPLAPVTPTTNRIRDNTSHSISPHGKSYFGFDFNHLHTHGKKR